MDEGIAKDAQTLKGGRRMRQRSGARMRWQSEAGQRGREHSTSVLVLVALERKRGAGRLLVGGLRAFALAVHVEGEHGVPEERVGGHPKHTHVRREQEKVNCLRERPVAEVELHSHLVYTVFIQVRVIAILQAVHAYFTSIHYSFDIILQYTRTCTQYVLYNIEYENYK